VARGLPQAAEGGGVPRPAPYWTRWQAPRKDSVDEVLLWAGFGEIDVFGIDKPLSSSNGQRRSTSSSIAVLGANPGRTC
jgi:hypothetical protein